MNAVDSKSKLSLFTCGPEDTIRRVMEVINCNSHEIAFVVDEGNRLVGTISDGDIRRALLAGDGLHSKARAVMNTQFRSVGELESRDAVLDLMIATQIRQIPILNLDGILQGIHFLQDFVGPAERRNPVLVLAGGRGRRLGNITETIPKPMVKVAGRPILERTVLQLVGQGFKQITLAVHYKAEVIQDYFGDGSRFGAQISYIHESTPLGTVGSLGLFRPSGSEAILMMNADLIADIDFCALVDFHKQRESDLTIAGARHTYSVPFGVLSVSGDRLMRIDEKPDYHHLISTGVYCVSPKMIDLVPASRPVGADEWITLAIESGQRVHVYQDVGEWMDVGTPRDLEKARGTDSISSQISF